jgi:DNA polymerase III subunit delta'
VNQSAHSLIGHQDAWQTWRSAMASSRMHHGWILAGPKGLGKAHFARAAAAELLAETGISQPDPHHHPDILLLEPLPATDKDFTDRDEGKPFKSKRNISIDQIRSMRSKLHTRPTLGSRRVVIIDSADGLETASVNALLKNLEEPPQGTHFLLITHRIGRLLPTIRSRCRVMRFAPLGDADMSQILAGAAPEASADTRKAAIVASQGSPGVALAFLDENLGQAHGLMQQILAQGDAEMNLRGALTEAIGAKPGYERQAAVLDLARAMVAQNIAADDTSKQQRVAKAYGELGQLAVQAPIYNFDTGSLGLEIGSLLASIAAPKD